MVLCRSLDSSAATRDHNSGAVLNPNNSATKITYMPSFRSGATQCFHSSLCTANVIKASDISINTSSMSFSSPALCAPNSTIAFMLFTASIGRGSTSRSGSRALELPVDLRRSTMNLLFTPPPSFGFTINPILEIVPPGNSSCQIFDIALLSVPIELNGCVCWIVLYTLVVDHWATLKLLVCVHPTFLVAPLAVYGRWEYPAALYVLWHSERRALQYPLDDLRLWIATSFYPSTE